MITDHASLHRVHLHDVGPEQGGGRADTGIVEEQGDAGVGPEHLLDARQVDALGEVGSQDFDRTAGPVGEPHRERGQTLDVAGDEDQVVAATGEAIRVDGADAGGSTGNQCGA